MKYKSINIPVKDFEKIKTYCNENTLKISKWTAKVLLEKIRRENEREK